MFIKDFAERKAEEYGYNKPNITINAEKINYDPKVNTNTSPERHTRKDYLTLQERNRDKQKTKLFDRSTMPDDAGDGYDMGNRFEDSDKTIISPTADRDFNIGDIVYIDQLKYIGRIKRISNNYIYIKRIGKSNLSAIDKSSVAILHKILPEDIKIHVEYDGKNYIVIPYIKDKYFYTLGKKIDNNTTELDIKNKVWEYFNTLL
ncbi:MAG: hypothetical protein ACFFG0_05300 [Candidatus Thorarchaeota archaeon]